MHCSGRHKGKRPSIGRSIGGIMPPGHIKQIPAARIRCAGAGGVGVIFAGLTARCGTVGAGIRRADVYRVQRA